MRSVSLAATDNLLSSCLVVKNSVGVPVMTDVLSAWRSEFPILDTCTYLVTHSLGAMPRRASTYLQQFAGEWSSRGVRAWNEGWWEIGRTTGDLLAPVLGV